MLALTDLSRAALLTAVNAKRAVLGLADLADLEATTSLKDGVIAGAVADAPSKVPKVQAGCRPRHAYGQFGCAEIQRIRGSMPQRRDGSHAIRPARGAARGTIWQGKPCCNPP